jgi:quercetin dioxygenase-like cupin family protein
MPPSACAWPVPRRYTAERHRAYDIGCRSKAREDRMAIYKTADMPAQRDEVAPFEAKSVAGELMKVGLVRYEEGKSPPPHFHPNEEQFIYLLEGRMRMVLGDEMQVIEPGDIVHIPRNVRHGILPVEGHVLFFTCKSPSGDGSLVQDYNRATDADEVIKALAESG